MPAKKSFKVGKAVSPKKIIKEVDSKSIQEIKFARKGVDFLAKTKTEPSFRYIVNIYKEKRGNPVSKLAMLTSINEVLKSRQKEWPKLYGSWKLFFTLEGIHKKKQRIRNHDN